MRRPIYGEGVRKEGRIQLTYLAYWNPSGYLEEASPEELPLWQKRLEEAFALSEAEGHEHFEVRSLGPHLVSHLVYLGDKERRIIRV